MDSVFKAHRLTARSSYGAELLAASHGFDDGYPTIIMAVELRGGALPTWKFKEFREHGCVLVKVILTLDAEAVFKSITS
eukprot:6698941-Karenia_brevis.AAC.1